jgi:hypothetical protein
MSSLDESIRDAYARGWVKSLSDDVSHCVDEDLKTIDMSKVLPSDVLKIHGNPKYSDYTVVFKNPFKE